MSGDDKEPEQPALFDNPPAWSEHWAGMPTFLQRDEKPTDTINVQFRTDQDRRDFLVMLGENPARRKSIWWPSVDYEKQSDRGAPAVVVEPNQHPVYVISKGRWDWASRLTTRGLNKLGINHYLVVEPTEAEKYAEAQTSFCELLLLPFHDLGQGSIPARNWVWDHARRSGAIRHWILDDNMDGFYRLNENKKTKVVDFNPFTAIEAFAERYSNLALAGMNYEFFADRRSQQPPFILNTRIYSCIFIDNALDLRWRGRYNEDTDLSLRALKAGMCTALFNSVLVKKMPTMTMAGGNTDELYKEDGRLKMAESLRDQHPDLVKITRKWGRWQHQVDYRPFKRNKLILKPEFADRPEVADDYGMTLETATGDQP